MEVVEFIERELWWRSDIFNEMYYIYQMKCIKCQVTYYIYSPK